MAKIFLNAKHWHIFTLAFALPFTFQVVLVPMFAVGNDPTILLKVMPAILALLIVGFFGWLWSIAVGLQSKIPAGIGMNINRFKLFFFIPLVYLVLILMFIAFGTGGLAEGGKGPDSATIALIVGIVVPIHLFAIFCIFYCLFFVAKTFKTVELQAEVNFSDFAGEFFLFWFYPIGVWILQPKINRMVKAKSLD